MSRPNNDIRNWKASLSLACVI